MIRFIKHWLMEGEAGNGGAPAGNAAPTSSPAATPAAPQAAPVAPQAQPAAPATPAAPAPAADATKGEPLLGGSELPVSYAKTGNVSLDTALDYIGKLGFMGDHPAMVEAGKGNFALLRAQFAQLGDKAPAGWQAMVDIGEASFKDYLKSEGEKQAAEDAVHNQIADSLGVNLGDVQTWANANADPAEKEQFNAMVKMGGFASQAAVFFLASQYAQANGAGFGGSAVVNAAVDGQAGQGGKITRQELARQGRELYQKYGDSYTQSTEYRNLLARVQR